MTSCSPDYRRSTKSLFIALTAIAIICFLLNMKEVSVYKTRSHLQTVRQHSGSLLKNYSSSTPTSKIAESDPTKTLNGDIKRFLTMKCSCRESEPRPYQTTHEQSTSSVCSPFSTARGTGQRVVAYSLYGTETSVQLRNKYLKSLSQRAKTIQEKLPGWIMRVYTSTEDTTGKRTDHVLCQLHCSFPHVDICNIRDLPILGDYAETRMTGMVWRFIPMVDPLVDVFISRDADSFILDREVACVAEWLSSSYMFHTLHDHPYHGIDILGGLWGAKLNIDRNLTHSIGMNILYDRQGGGNYHDMQLLKRHIWKHYKNNTLCHASYECTSMPCREVRPFPTKRIGKNFTGFGGTQKKIAQVILKTKCPIECRPEDHKDWEYC